MKKSTEEEAVIISGLQAGGIQRRLYEKKLYKHFFYLIRHGAQKYNLREDESASAYSDTIINVITNIVTRRFEDRSTLKTYVHQIFMNKCIDIVRKKTTHKESLNYKTGKIDTLIHILPDSARNMVEQMMHENEQALLRRKVQELGEKCCQLLLLHEDDYSDQDIARMMQYKSVEVVQTTRQRCLKKLREMVLSQKKSHD